MNIKTLISFLAFMVVVAIVYLTINTVFELSRQDMYGVKFSSSSVSTVQFKSYQPKGLNYAATSQSMGRINTQQSFSSETLLPQMSVSGRRSETRGTINPNGFGSFNQQGFVGQNTLPSALSSGDSSSGIQFSRTSGRISTNERAQASAAYGSGSFNENRFSSAAPLYEPFSSGGAGIPDPGGNIDDSCDDDIVFLPVPDGLYFLIFLGLIYALIKLFGKTITKYLTRFA
jgi:hypothetical protein